MYCLLFKWTCNSKPLPSFRCSAITPVTAMLWVVVSKRRQEAPLSSVDSLMTLNTKQNKTKALILEKLPFFKVGIPTVCYLLWSRATYSNSYIDGSGCHWSCQTAHQEQFGVLAQGHFNMQTRLPLSHSRPKFVSFEPDSNQRPKDFSSDASTVLRSTNWAIEGTPELLKGRMLLLCKGLQGHLVDAIRTKFDSFVLAGYTWIICGFENARFFWQTL